MTQKTLSIHEVAELVNREYHEAHYGVLPTADGKRTVIFGNPNGYFDTPTTPISSRILLQKLRERLITGGNYELAFAVSKNKTSWAMIVNNPDTVEMFNVVWNIVRLTFYPQKAEAYEHPSVTCQKAIAARVCGIPGVSDPFHTNDDRRSGKPKKVAV